MIYIIITVAIIIIASASIAAHSIYKLWRDYPDDGGYN
jgi:hypothetical protein